MHDRVLFRITMSSTSSYVCEGRFGWWHGAEALRLLVAANVRAQHVWGIGLKSEARARAALAYVRAKSR